MAKQQGCFAAQQSCAAKSFFAFRHHIIIINKIDVMNVFDFDLEKCKEYVWRLNPNMKVIPICARTGEGVQEWADWLREQTRAWIK